MLFLSKHDTIISVVVDEIDLNINEIEKIIDRKNCKYIVKVVWIMKKLCIKSLLKKLERSYNYECT